MKRTWCAWFSCLLFMTGIAQENHFELKQALPKELKEISGLVKDGDFLWAISDNNKAPIFKLDLSGNIVQRLHLVNFTVSDVEAVTADQSYLYIGDIGDNNGTRPFRSIIRIAKSSIGKGSTADVKGEEIRFVFSDGENAKKKKTNNYDCEAMISYDDALYLFTKRRDDEKTELYKVPKSPGTHTAAAIAIFKTKGLVTDAAVSPSGNEIVLVGYDPGHTQPFLWLLSNFKSDNFFSGEQQRVGLTNQKRLDWQLESVTYKDRETIYLACEKTRDVPGTIYLIKKPELQASKKEN
jgi:hypothetical protein